MKKGCLITDGTALFKTKIGSHVNAPQAVASRRSIFLHNIKLAQPGADRIA